MSTLRTTLPVPVLSVPFLGAWRVVWVRPMAPSPGALVQASGTLSTTVYPEFDHPPLSLFSALWDTHWIYTLQHTLASLSGWAHTHRRHRFRCVPYLCRVGFIDSQSCNDTLARTRLTIPHVNRDAARGASCHLDLAPISWSDGSLETMA